MILFMLTSIGIGILFAIPGIAFGSFLEKHQIASNRIRDVLATSVFFVLFRQVWYPQIPYIWLALAIILGTTMGLYRVEIFWAMKSKDKDKR